MNEEIFNANVEYNYYILKDVQNGKVMSIRMVGETHESREWLEANGYQVTFVGNNAIEYTFKN